MIDTRAVDARQMIDGVLRYSKATHGTTARATVDVAGTVAHVVDRFNHRECEVIYVGSVERLRVSRIAFEQTLQNLIGNAIQVNDKAHCRVEIDGWRGPEELYVFSVQDNGPGIPPQHRESIFQLFHTVPAEGRQEGPRGGAFHRAAPR